MNRRSFVVALFLSTFAIAQTTHPAHDPRVWEKDIEKFEAADKKNMPAPGGVLFVGSSSIRFWKAAEAFPNANAINRGFGGSFGSDAVFYMDRIVVPYKPRTIVFYGGENDIASGVSAKDAAQGVVDFINQAHEKLPDAKIIIVGIKPDPLRWKYEDRFRQANALIRAAVDKTPGAVFIDVEKEMLGEDGKPLPGIYRVDGLHMNEKGYAIWDKLLAPYMSNDGQK